MSNFNQQRAAWEPDVFNDEKLSLRGKPIQDGGWNTRLRIKTKENNPCIEVSTGLKDKRDRQIRHDVSMTPRVFEEVLYVLEAVAKSKSAVSYEIENWNYVWKWDQQSQKSNRSETPEVVCRISIHKREDGVVGMDFAFRGGKTIVPFVFEPDDFHKWMNGGNYMAAGEQSKIAALAWARTIRQVYVMEFVNKWTEPEWQKRSRLERMQRATGQTSGGGYGGGKSQGSGQQSGGYSNNQPPAGADGGFTDSFGSSMDFDEDVPL